MEEQDAPPPLNRSNNTKLIQKKERKGYNSYILMHILKIFFSIFVCIDIYSELTCNFPKIFTHPLPRFETNFLFGPVFIYSSNSDHTGGLSLLLFHGESLIKATYEKNTCTKISINNIRFSRPF